MTGDWAPDRGDLVWLSFSPQAGREQACRRPALVLSPRLYNARAGLALVCPVTSRRKGYPFEVELGSRDDIVGVVLADQCRSLDWRERDAQPAGQVGVDVVAAVLARLRRLLD